MAKKINSKPHTTKPHQSALFLPNTVASIKVLSAYLLLLLRGLDSLVDVGRGLLLGRGSRLVLLVLSLSRLLDLVVGLLLRSTAEEGLVSLLGRDEGRLEQVGVCGGRERTSSAGVRGGAWQRGVTSAYCPSWRSGWRVSQRWGRPRSRQPGRCRPMTGRIRRWARGPSRP